MICHRCSLPVREPGTQTGRLWQKQTHTHWHTQIQGMPHKHPQHKQNYLSGTLSSLTTAWTKTNAHTSHTDLSKKCVCVRNVPFYNTVDTESHTPPNIRISDSWDIEKPCQLSGSWLWHCCNLQPAMSLFWIGKAAKISKMSLWLNVVQLMRQSLSVNFLVNIFQFIDKF